MVKSYIGLIIMCFVDVKIVFFVVACMVLSCDARPKHVVTPDDKLETVGLYAFDPAEREHYLFWRACGYNFLQFIDKGLWVPEAERAAYYDRLEQGIADAQRHGFAVGILLQSNVLSHPHDWWETFDPRDSVAMRSRLHAIEAVVKRCKAADVMEFYAGDPGGSPDSLGVEGIASWKRMAGEVKQIVERHAPAAKFNVNVWAVAHWDYIQISPWATYFWDKEVQYGREIAEDRSLVHAETGIEVPMHNYYRSLAFKAYGDVNREPKLFPLAEDVEALRQRGVTRIWGWAHFMIDEVDDGYTGYAGTKMHPTQAETRYLHRIVSDARRIGMNGMISNCGGASSLVEAMNVYAFARFCQQPDLSPEDAIDEYAGHLVDDTTGRKIIGQVIRFIENHSTWEQSIPQRNRIDPFECRFKTAHEALEALASVELRGTGSVSSFALPERAQDYIERLHGRLRDIISTQ